LKQGGEGTSVAEICRKAGISQTTHFSWKKKYAGVLRSSVRYLDLPLQVPPLRQTALERRIKDICETRVRCGYRRVQVLLRRESWAIDMKNISLTMR
jgi:transposase-like protein